MTDQNNQPSWETEPEQQALEQPTELKIKAHLVLEGSEKYEWGVVKDCKGCINIIPPDAEVVGTWNKYGDGTYWVSITTPIEALVDRATQLFSELAEKRLLEGEPIKKQSVIRRTKRETPVTEEVSPVTARLQALRDRLKANK